VVYRRNLYHSELFLGQPEGSCGIYTRRHFEFRFLLYLLFAVMKIVLGRCGQRGQYGQTRRSAYPFFLLLHRLNP
jgi:hypothetical protein